MQGNIEGSGGRGLISEKTDETVEQMESMKIPTPNSKFQHA